MSDSFRTKAGRCVVGDGHVRLDTDGGGWLATVSEALTTNEIPVWRRGAVVLFYVALVAGVVLLVRATPPWVPGALAGLLLAALGWSWLTDRGPDEDAEDEIPLGDVVGVDPYFGVPLLTRPRFVIRYRSEGGVKHRHLQCPSRLYGFGAYEKGKALFAERGLLVEESGLTSVEA